jgi:hypothetical protein
MSVPIDLKAAARRCVVNLEAGRPAATADLKAAGTLLALADGCTCDSARLHVTVAAPDGVDPRPVIHVDGHANLCPALQLWRAGSN